MKAAIAGFLTLAVALTPVGARAEETPAHQDSSRPEVSLLQPGGPVAQLGAAMLDAGALARPGGMYFSLSTGASVFTGRRNFVFGNEIPVAGPGPLGQSFSYDLGGTGIGASGTLGYWLRDWLALEASLSGAYHSAGSQQGCVAPQQSPGTANLLLIPLIKGGLATTPIFRCDLTDTQFQSRFDYSQGLIDAHLDARVVLWRSSDRRSEVDAVGGIAYLNSNQNLSQTASGITAGIPTPINKLTTDIGIGDNLAGLRLGLRARQQLGPALTLVGSLLGDFYGRTSTLQATQTGTNVNLSFGTTTPALSLFKSDNSRGFVPRLEASVALNYDLNDSWSLGLFYKFDGLWNMTSPGNQSVFCAFNYCATNRDMSIMPGDNQYIHSVGVGVTGRF